MTPAPHLRTISWELARSPARTAAQSRATLVCQQLCPARHLTPTRLARGESEGALEMDATTEHPSLQTELSTGNEVLNQSLQGCQVQISQSQVHHRRGQMLMGLMLGLQDCLFFFVLTGRLRDLDRHSFVIISCSTCRSERTHLLCFVDGLCITVSNLLLSRFIRLDGRRDLLANGRFDSLLCLEESLVIFKKRDNSHLFELTGEIKSGLPCSVGDA
eukprot:m.274373 g.274373  ORF g.274373 m.274373 type:complete len:217 (-) comp54830_c1_seq8:147-797(-)